MKFRVERLRCIGDGGLLERKGDEGPRLLLSPAHGGGQDVTDHALSPLVEEGQYTVHMDKNIIGQVFAYRNISSIWGNSIFSFYAQGVRGWVSLRF